MCGRKAGAFFLEMSFRDCVAVRRGRKAKEQRHAHGCMCSKRLFVVAAARREVREMRNFV